MFHPSRGWGALIGLGVLGLASLPALAGLGGDYSSVATDRASMRGQVRTAAPTVGFTVEQMQLPSGTVVTEYISPAGKVFAVTWSGPTKPDLRTTLGSYFQQVVSASQKAQHNTGTRRHFQLREPDLIFESHGRMRAFFGRAYIPSLLPPNVSVDQIR